MVMSGDCLIINKMLREAHQIVVVVSLVLDILLLQQMFIIRIFSFLVYHQEVNLKNLEMFFLLVEEEVVLL